MSLLRFLLRNLLYHWRGNVPVLLGVLVGSAVLTGALLVGDSLRGSLHDRTLRRLGWVDQALVVPRFFRASLADALQKDTQGRVSPALMLQATCTFSERAAHVQVGREGTDRLSVRGVTVLGVDPSFFAPREPPAGFGGITESGKPRVHVSSALARALHLNVGDRLTLRLEKPSALPRENVLANKKTQTEEWELVVGGILEGDEPGNLFNLRPELEEPKNILIPLVVLQDYLKLRGQANALFASADPEALKQGLIDHLDPDDWGLTLYSPTSRSTALLARLKNQGKRRRGKLAFAGIVTGGDRPRPTNSNKPTQADIERFFLREHPYLALESKQLLLSSAISSAALDAARDCNLDFAPTLVYLCKLDAGGKRIAGVVAALPLDRPPPLGPFLPPGKKTLGENEIVVADWGWPAENRPAVGSKVVLTFKPAESTSPAGAVPDRTSTFRLAGYLPLKGVAADPYLTPEFPGITDKDDTSDWDLPFDDPAWDKETIRKEYTDAFWDTYRATPRAYIRLPAGQMLWSSRFGDLTSIRLAPKDKQVSLDEAAERFKKALRKRLEPEAGGFVFDEVKKTALQASAGGVPFDWLFLGFSCFLILSALLLVGLLFRLNLDRRAQQVGLLFAEGFPRSTVRWLLLGEGAVLALVGVVLGGLAALGYSRLLVDLLAYLWPGGALKSFLAPHASATSLILGAAGAMLVSLLTIAWVVYVLGKVPPRMLLAGQTINENEPTQPGSPRWSLRILIGAVVLGVVLLLAGPWMPGGQEARAGTFFSAGGLFLTAGLVGFLIWMRHGRSARVEEPGSWSVARLGIRNAARHPMRSLLTVGLLASAAFLIVAVESFRRQAEPSNGSKEAPDGGFSLVAESDLPLFRDLNSQAGRDDVLARLQEHLQNEQKLPFAEAEKQVKKAAALLDKTTVVAFRLRAGDDASCLNLYQPRRPRILGVPAALIERGGFVFDSTLTPGSEEKSDLWRILERESGERVPAFGEANTVGWMLKSGLDKTISVPDEKGAATPLLIAGLLKDSVFQSSLLVSEENFLKLYPSHEGYNYFLIAPPKGEQDSVKRILEEALADRGFEVIPTADRLQAYLAVENTYLTTFQALGGLGLLLGSLGLAVVLLRAVWERRGELALLRALGYRRRTLAWLVLAENAFLLLIGLSIGAVSALLSILPQLVMGAGAVPWRNLVLLFAGVLAVALAAGMVAVAGTLRAPIVPALRRE